MQVHRKDAASREELPANKPLWAVERVCWAGLDPYVFVLSKSGYCVWGQRLGFQYKLFYFWTYRL